MNSKLKRTLALAALLTGVGGLTGVANATEGWYGRADVGVSFDGELEGDIDDGNNTDTIGADLDDGWLAGAGIGYAFSSGFRVEAELSYRKNQWDVLDLDPPDGDFTGDTKAYGLLANFFYDFNRGGTIQPFIGVGAGGARVEVGVDGFDSAADTVFAYQGLAGVGFRLSDRATLDVTYRYFAAPEVDISEAWGPGYTSEVDYVNQAVTVGLRWQFAGAAPPPPEPTPYVAPPPPPPPPVAATCPTSEFVVYFEWDRSNLNQAALETIDAAVNRARQCNVGGVVVVGHTDTSGSPTYNQGLSERRAGVVRDALVARGIAAGSIQTQARGESDLARATRDGVREPLNRRTAVTISFR
jgi:outer membrane protein OmpA-like peptidoglycan-associated protein